MSKTRIKINLPLLASREEVEYTVNELANVANNKRKLVARLDSAILKLKDEAAAGIAACDEALAAKTDALRAWAESHPEEFPKGRKSVVFLSGTVGFRTGTPKLALLSRAWNWDKVLEAVQSRAFSFTRTSTELDKDAILAFAAGSTDAADKQATEEKVLRPIGINVIQDESFYVEPKLTDAEVQS